MRKSFATAWKHIRRSPYQTLAATAVLTVTFFAASIFTLLTLGTDKILRYFETRPQVTAFFEDTATSEQVDSLRQDLETQTFVADVKYVSNEEALAIYREQNKDDPLLLELVTADILPASLEVSGINAQVLPQIAELMTGRAGVEDVVYQKDVIEALRKWTNSLRLVGLGLVAFLVFTSILIIMVITGMKISARRHEIEILNLLGATGWYIKNPFLIEGILYGVVGAFVAWLASYLILLYATPFLVSFLGSIPLLPVSVWVMLSLLGGELGFGVLIGTIGSLVAVRRFLR